MFGLVDYNDSDSQKLPIGIFKQMALFENRVPPQMVNHQLWLQSEVYPLVN